MGVNASIHSGEIDTEAAHNALPERIDEKVGWLRDGAGDRFDDLELNAWLAAAELSEDPTLPAAMAALFGTDVDSFRNSPLALVGAPTEVGELLQARRSRWGYSYTVDPRARRPGLRPAGGPARRYLTGLTGGPPGETVRRAGG